MRKQICDKCGSNIELFDADNDWCPQCKVYKPAGTFKIVSAPAVCEEEEVAQLKAEFEWLTAREQKWLELVKWMDLFLLSVQIYPDAEMSKELKQLRSELMEQKEGEDG